MSSEKPDPRLPLRIENVSPTPREMRPLKRGWGLIPWICLIPTYAYLFGFILFGVAAVDMAEGLVPADVFIACLITTFVVWSVGFWWQRGAIGRATARAPASGQAWLWEIDDNGFIFSSALQTNRMDWRAIKAVIEEKDRFLLLVLPMSNPILPKRLLSTEQTEAFRALLQRQRQSGRLGAGVD